jgi:hypothetical protein
MSFSHVFSIYLHLIVDFGDMPCCNSYLTKHHDDDVHFTELQYVDYKNLYPYGPAKTAYVQNEIKTVDK